MSSHAPLERLSCRRRPPSRSQMRAIRDQGLVDERFERHEAVRVLHAQLRIDFIGVEVITARTITGIAKTEVRHNDLPYGRR